MCAVKLDMHNAYDRVEWVFLRNMMLKLGFHEQCVDMIMECVCLVRYKVRLNSQESDSIIPTRGIRQGVLSPLTYS